MSDSGVAEAGRMWPYAVGGALFMFALMVLANAGDTDEPTGA